MSDSQSSFDDVGAGVGGLAVLLVLFVLCETFSFLTSEQGQRFLAAIAKFLAVAALMPAIGASVVVRGVVGLVGDLAGAQLSVGRAALAAIVLAPFAFLFLSSLLFLTIALAGYGSLAVLAAVLTAGMSLFELPAYYVAWWTNAIPVPGVHRKLDVPFKTDVVARTEGMLALGRLAQDLRIGLARLKIAVWGALGVSDVPGLPHEEIQFQ